MSEYCIKVSFRSRDRFARRSLIAHDINGRFSMSTTVRSSNKKKTKNLGWKKTSLSKKRR